MEIGYKVKAKTIAEFLNKTFGTNYKLWLKSTYELDDSTTVWMIKIDGEKRNTFKNYFDNENIVEESYEEKTRSLNPIRMVFQIVEKDNFSIKLWNIFDGNNIGQKNFDGCN